MRIYKPILQPKVLRINIKKQLVKTEILTIEDCTQLEFLEYVKKLIEAQNLSIFQTGKLTNIEIREGQGTTNGKSVSISFKGLEPIEVKNLIIKDLTK